MYRSYFFLHFDPLGVASLGITVIETLRRIPRSSLLQLSLDQALTGWICTPNQALGGWKSNLAPMIMPVL